MLTKKYNQSLKDRNTFMMDVECKCLIEYDSIMDLTDIDFEDLPLPIKHIGGGSNILFTDDFKGTLLHSTANDIYVLPKTDDLYSQSPKETVIVSASAGVKTDDLCKWASENELWGIENLSHIPGEVGGAVVQNIGAYGVELSDIVIQVYCYDIIEEEFTHFDKEECGFAYRSSVFKQEGFRDRYIITNVIFALSENSEPNLEYGKLEEIIRKQLPDKTKPSPSMVREAVIQIRKEKLPEVGRIGSAGSFFRNPIVSEESFDGIVKAALEMGVKETDIPFFKVEGGVKVPAAWLIEQCGWKGKRSGNAGVYEKQALVLTNATGRAMPEEIIRLKDKITDSVRKTFGVSLEAEVEII